MASHPTRNVIQSPHHNSQSLAWVVRGRILACQNSQGLRDLTSRRLFDLSSHSAPPWPPLHASDTPGTLCLRVFAQAIPPAHPAPASRSIWLAPPIEVFA